ncbi:hypothetical protein [Actinomadura sp. WMMB 499]|uniref:hypothetical protein n=1 Tax=Actinomadura sp. WMMB 499 TaxID=1219491 RepID=UPI00124449F6|nr:hypothetical protein [Actinomadura sp. WMMB 499]QFG22391.1 hypothetical protein F7P10_15910 [Actinomadura sp. WMMB 499]
MWSPRTQKRLWIAAAVVSAAPLVLMLGYVLFGPSGGQKLGFGITGMVALGQCQGWQQQGHLWSLPGYGFFPQHPWAIVLPAFVMWLVVRRRAVGWAAIALLTPYLLIEPLLFGYDVARWGSTCAELWYPLQLGTRQIFWQVYDLVPLVLILAATHRPGRATVRTAAALLVTTPLFAVAGDRDAPVPLSSPEACRNIDWTSEAGNEISVRAVAGMSERERKLTYLCRVRGFSMRHPESRILRFTGGQPSDAILLDEGRRACDGERRIPPQGIRMPSFREYVYLCPKVAVAHQREAERARAKADAEYERRRAKVKAFCEQQAPEANARPVREFTDVLSGDLMRAYHVGELPEGAGSEGFPTDDLVITQDGTATVTTDTEDRICLTVRAYRREPPPDLDGWDRVVEVGLASPDGRTTIMQMGSPSGFPALTAAGQGRYRLRVHVTGRDLPDSWVHPAQRHLLVVFPGSSEKREVLK